MYYNLIPDDWDAPIAAGAFTVTLPKSFDTQKVEFTGGRYGGVDTGLVDWSVSGNTISGQLTRSLSPGEGITLRVNLPDGYFVGVRTCLLYTSGIFKGAQSADADRTDFACATGGSAPLKCAFGSRAFFALGLTATAQPFPQ